MTTALAAPEAKAEDKALDASARYIKHIAELEGKELSAADIETKKQLFVEMQTATAEAERSAHAKMVEARQSDTLDDIGEERVVKSNHKQISDWQKTIESVRSGETKVIELKYPDYSSSGTPGMHTQFSLTHFDGKQAIVVQPKINDPNGTIGGLMGVQTQAALGNQQQVGLQQRFVTHTTTTDAPIPVSYIDMWSAEEANNGVMLSDCVDVERTNRIEERIFPRLDSEPAIPLTSVAENDGGSTGGTRNGTFGELTPGYDEVSIKMYKYGALSEISDEVMHSAYVNNFWGAIAETFVYRMAYTMNRVLTTGTGSSQPHGIITAIRDSANDGSDSNNRRQITKSTAQGAYTSLTIEQILKLQGDLDIGYAGQGERISKFMLNQQAAVAVATETNTSRFIASPNEAFARWNMAVQNQAIYSFNLMPVLANPHMSTADNAPGNVLAVYGDLKAYKTLLGPVRLDFSSEYAWARAGMALRVMQYVGGNLRKAQTRGSAQKGRIVYIETKN